MLSSDKRLGIALSGGGYRATAFHLGTLKKLHQLGILEKADVLSTISGGSITGACYSTHVGTFDEFYSDLYSDLQTKNVVRTAIFSWLGFRLLIAVLLLVATFGFFVTPYPWLFIVSFFPLLFIIIRYQFLLFPVSRRIEEIYKDFFYRNKTLSQLNGAPTLVVSSTNLQTSRPFIFSRTRMGDSNYQFRKTPILFIHQNFPVARAVMASTCVPFAFTPVKIDQEFFNDPSDFNVVHPIIVDGGVYDNQGIHKVMQDGEFNCPIVITSDAGGGNSSEFKVGNTIALLKETVFVFMNRIKNAQMVDDVYNNAKGANKQIAYLSLGWDVERCIPGFIDNLEKKQITRTVIEAHQLKAEWVDHPRRYEKEIEEYLKQKTKYDSIVKPTDAEKRIARRVGTSLTSLSKEQVDCLIKQAEALTELQVKLYCPLIV